MERKASYCSSVPWGDSPLLQHIPTLREDVVYYADPTAQEYPPDKAPINLRVWAWVSQSFPHFLPYLWHSKGPQRKRASQQPTLVTLFGSALWWPAIPVPIDHLESYFPKEHIDRSVLCQSPFKTWECYALWH